MYYRWVMQIIIKKYQHYNRTLGKYISSKADYENEMAKQGYVSWETGEALAEKAREANRKKYDKLSDQAMGVCKAAKDQADKKGNLRPSSRLIDGMKKTGVCFDLDKLPKAYRDVGGFDATNP